MTPIPLPFQQTDGPTDRGEEGADLLRFGCFLDSASGRYGPGAAPVALHWRIRGHRPGQGEYYYEEWELIKVTIDRSCRCYHIALCL